MALQYMNNLKKENSFWQNILTNTVISIIFLAVYDLKLFLAPYTSSKVLQITFMLFCVNIPTFLKMYLKKENTKDSSEVYSNDIGATVEEKIEAATEVKEILAVPISIKTWIFVVGMGYLSYWYFLRNVENPTVENLFTAIFLGVFFALVLVGLYQIVKDEKER